MATAGYSTTPLSRKLGIKPGARLALVSAPAGIEATLGELPEGAVLKRRAGYADLTLWFVKRAGELERRITRMVELLGPDGLWIAWPKKSSGMQTDLNGNDVRRAGLDCGLVDVKVCAVDETWSALKFVRRRE